MNRNSLRNFTIIFGGVTAVASGVLLSPALPEMAAHFASVPNAAFLVQMALIVPSFFIAISAPFIGAILDRIGRRPRSVRGSDAGPSGRTRASECARPPAPPRPARRATTGRLLSSRHRSDAAGGHVLHRPVRQ